MTNLSLIVAGPGKTTDAEVSDLLEDFVTNSDIVGEEGVDVVDVYYPMSAKAFTSGVHGVLEWANNPENGGSDVGITVKGTTASRAAKAYFHIVEEELNEPKEWIFDKFEEVFELDFGDNEVFFLAAAPQEGEEPTDEEVDALISYVEAAKVNNIDVKDLCAGLDDVNLSAPEPAAEPDPEPAPEPERPRGRRKAEPKAEEPVDGLQEQVILEGQSATTHFFPPSEEDSTTFRKSVKDLPESSLYIMISDLFYELAVRSFGAAHPASVVVEETTDEPDAPAAEEQPAEEATAAPRRGRGRPRVNPNLEKQIWDELANPEDGAGGDWMPRPRGRVAKGTRYRTVNLDTGDVTEEGTV